MEYKESTNPRLCNTKLDALIDKCARSRGLAMGRGKYGRYKDFKTKWFTKDEMVGGNRSRSVSLIVTDYMKGAPDRLLEEYLLSQVDECSGRGRPLMEPCSEAFSAFMDSDVFIGKGRKTYLSRSTTIREATDGDRLLDAYGWLDERSLVPERAEGAVLCWDDITRGLWKSSTNIMFKVVEIPSSLEEGDGMSPAVAFLMFRQMCLMSTPFDPIGFSHETDAAALLDRFPRDVYEDAMKELIEKGLWKREMAI